METRLQGTYYKNKELQQTTTDPPLVRIDKEINWLPEEDGVIMNLNIIQIERKMLEL